MLTSFPVNEIQYIEKTERKENFLIFLDLNLNRARTWLFIYITFNTLHVALRYLLLTFSITGHCINLLQVFLLPRPIIALPSSRAFCMFSKRSFILEFRESFQVSNSSRQELSWSSSWSNASYSEAKKEEMFVIDQARGQDGWLLVKFFFFFFFFIDWDAVEVNKDAKKEGDNIQPYWPNKLGQSRIYYNYLWPIRELFSCRNDVGNSLHTGWAHLAHSGS